MLGRVVNMQNGSQSEIYQKHEIMFDRLKY